MDPDLFGKPFLVLDKLGEGAFAEVFKVKSHRTGEFLAIKRLKKRYRTLDEAAKLPEISTLRILQGHPNVVKLIDILYDAPHGYLAFVFELLSMNLNEVLHQRKAPFDEKSALLIVFQILKAVAFMHENFVFHRDIKPENCMVNKDTLELKLVDFGSARQTAARGPFTEYVSTRWYRAPECILTAGSYGPAVDIWAVGCIFYEILTTRPLFPGKHEIDQIARIHHILGTPAREVLAQFSQNPNKQIAFAFPPRQPQELGGLLPFVSGETLDLLRGLLVYNPIDRITAEEAIEHPVFEELRNAERRWKARGCPGPFAVFATMDPAQWPEMQPVMAFPPSMWKPRVEQKVEENVQRELPAANLIDTRRVAAERVKAYQKKHLGGKPKIKQPTVMRITEPRIMKPPRPLPQPIVGLPYPRPGAELLQTKPL
jgi:renal tumor antigen